MMKRMLAVLMTLLVGGAAPMLGAGELITNGGFEIGCDPSTAGFKTGNEGAAATGWEFMRHSGISHADCKTWVSSYPDGSSVVCFIQAKNDGSAGWVTQDVSVPADDYYKLSFQYVGRNDGASKYFDQKLTVYFDGTEVWSKRVNSDLWDTASASVWLRAGKYTLRFVGTHPSDSSYGDNCSAIDNVSLKLSADCSTWAEVKANISNGSNANLTRDIMVGDGKSGWQQPCAFKTATLDLKGHKLYVPSSCYRAFVSQPQQGGGSYTLTLKDSVGGGMVCRPSGDTKQVNQGGSFVRLSNGDTFVMESGVIDGLTCGNNEEGSGAVSLSTIDASTFIMNGGTIQNCVAAGLGGGAVCMNHVKAVFKMNGGTISGNKALNGDGGGVYVGNGTFEMSGGNISGNTASRYGGGVALSVGCVLAITGSNCNIELNTAKCGGGISCESALMTMSGGNVFNNDATEMAGGVMLQDSYFEMSGGNILRNKVTAEQDGWSHVGGGVCVLRGTFKLKEGYVDQNSAPSGGGIAVKDGGTLEITTNGRVMHNTATDWGGGVAVESGSRFTLSGGEIGANVATGASSLGGGVCSSGAFTMTDGIIRLNKSVNGSALYLNVDGDKVISGGLVRGTLYVQAGKASFCGGVFDERPPSVASGYETVEVSSYYVVAQSGTWAMAGGVLTGGRYRFDLLANPEYGRIGIVASGSDFYTTVVSVDPKVWQLNTILDTIGCKTWQEARLNLNVGNGVRVAEDMTAETGSVTVPAGKRLKLDLGKSTITSRLSTPLFTLDKADASLTVVGDGRITNAVAAADHDGGCFNVSAGSLDLKGGTYAGFTVSQGHNGGCVYVGEGAAFTLNGGTISNCWAGGSGGAMASKGVCTVSTGLITCNGAANAGGALAALGGTTTVVGGEFAANGAVKGWDSPTNGAAVAALNGTRLVVSGGYYHDNGAGSTLCIRLAANGSAQVLGGLFGPNGLGSESESRNILIDSSQGGDEVTVHGCFMYGQNPQAFGNRLDAKCESVVVKTNWWTVALRGTVRISNERVIAGTFTFDPLSEAHYVQQNLVPNGSRSIHTAATGGGLDTWQLETSLGDILYYEGRCIGLSGNHLFRTYLTTKDGDATSETNHVVVRLDANGYYAGNTLLNITEFIDAQKEAYLAIDIYSEDGKEIKQQETRQRIGFVPYAIHTELAESAKVDAVSSELLTVRNSAKVGVLTVNSSLVVSGSCTVTNELVNARGKIANVSVDTLNVLGRGTTFFEPIGTMSLAPDARTDWLRVASNTTGTIRSQDGMASKTVNCAYDGLLFIVGATTGGAVLKLEVTRTGGTHGQETLFAHDGIVTDDGKGIDLSAAVVRGDTIRIAASVSGAGNGMVAYRYVTFGSPREEK